MVFWLHSFAAKLFIVDIWHFALAVTNQRILNLWYLRYFCSLIGATPQNHGTDSPCKLPNINFFENTARIPVKVGVNEITAELTAHHPSFGEITKTFVIHGSMGTNGKSDLIFPD